MDAIEPPNQGLSIRTGADGSFSLWSEAFGEGFHSPRGALREARETFLHPSELDRFPPGSTIRVLEVCVGTGCNLAVLLEACGRRGLQLAWIGLELDPEPLELALGQAEFRRAWQPRTLAILEQLRQRGAWRCPSTVGMTPSPGDAALPPIGASQHPSEPSARHPSARCDSADGAGEGRDGERPTPSAPADAAGAACPGGGAESGRSGPRGRSGGGTAASCGRMLWGDARRTVGQLRAASLGLDPLALDPIAPDSSVAGGGGFDLIWHDAFSPQRCPQLWTEEFLAGLLALLRPEGRWISYCSAAAVREALRRAGMEVVALHSPPQAHRRSQNWSGGTLAGPGPWPPSALWRALTPMEEDHLACSAGEPYRDPDGESTAAAILTARQGAQAEALAQGRRGSSSAWRQRWGVEA